MCVFVPGIVVFATGCNNTFSQSTKHTELVSMAYFYMVNKVCYPMFKIVPFSRVNRFSFYCHFQAGCSPPQCSNVTNHELIYAVNSSQELDMTPTNLIDPYKFENCSDWLISFWNRMILFIFYQVD